jgi:hypothetical protein
VLILKSEYLSKLGNKMSLIVIFSTFVWACLVINQMIDLPSENRDSLSFNSFLFVPHIRACLTGSI